VVSQGKEPQQLRGGKAQKSRRVFLDLPLPSPVSRGPSGPTAPRRSGDQEARGYRQEGGEGGGKQLGVGIRGVGDVRAEAFPHSEKQDLGRPRLKWGWQTMHLWMLWSMGLWG
jgi:hypothetical protein